MALNEGDVLGVANRPPYFRVNSRDGEWVRIQRVLKGTLCGPELRMKVVCKRGKELVRLRQRGPVRAVDNG
jgi:hypothetical protein